MLEHYVANLKEVVGIYKSELADLKKIMSIYEPGQRTVILRKIAFGPLHAIQMYLSSTRSSFLLISTKTFWGERMCVIVPEGGSISLVTTGFIEPELTKWILRHVQSGMTVLDVGAHFGYFTMLASHLVGPKGQVHAFEPTPSTFSILELNAEKRSNVFTNRVACFSRNGSSSLYDYGHRYSGFNTLMKPRMTSLTELRRVQVPTVMLDDYVESNGLRPDFIKIDAESSELEILKGMKEIIERYHPMISLEVGDFVPQATPSRDLVNYLVGKGYRAYEVGDGIMKEHLPLETYGYDNLLFVFESNHRVTPSG